MIRKTLGVVVLLTPRACLDSLQGAEFCEKLATSIPLDIMIRTMKLGKAIRCKSQTQKPWGAARNIGELFATGNRQANCEDNSLHCSHVFRFIEVVEDPILEDLLPLLF